MVYKKRQSRRNQVLTDAIGAASQLSIQMYIQLLFRGTKKVVKGGFKCFYV